MLRERNGNTGAEGEAERNREKGEARREKGGEDGE